MPDPEQSRSFTEIISGAVAGGGTTFVAIGVLEGILGWLIFPSVALAVAAWVVWFRARNRGEGSVRSRPR